MYHNSVIEKRLNFSQFLLMKFQALMLSTYLCLSGLLMVSIIFVTSLHLNFFLKNIHLIVVVKKTSESSDVDKITGVKSESLLFECTRKLENIIMM